ncbi:MAG: DUF692 domain-containing protein [Myxococcales bacterium]|nr:DUF692 domain-containing protein [Myxococcales bacterium]
MTMPTPREIPRHGLGLSLRPEHHQALRESTGAVDFLECIADNYLEFSDIPRRNLDQLAAKYPIVPHSVSLNLAGTDPLDSAFLARLAWLARRVNAPFVTDHLCWTKLGDAHLYDLLPVPYATELIPWVCERIQAARSAIGIPFGIENVSTYARFGRDEMPEWEFVSRIAETADCGLLLDLNNIYVSAVNHGFDAMDYLRAIPWKRVLYVHVAGHQTRPDGLLHDTHDRPVSEDVWRLYAAAWRLGGPFPTVLEWDADLPDFATAVAELETARKVRV